MQLQTAHTYKLGLSILQTPHQNSNGLSLKGTLCLKPTILGEKKQPTSSTGETEPVAEKLPLTGSLSSLVDMPLFSTAVGISKKRNRNISTTKFNAKRYIYTITQLNIYNWTTRSCTFDWRHAY